MVLRSYLLVVCNGYQTNSIRVLYDNATRESKCPLQPLDVIMLVFVGGKLNECDDFLKLALLGLSY